VGKVEGKRPLGKPGFRWEDNIKLNLETKGWDLFGLDLYQNRKKLAGCFERNDETSCSIKCGEFVG
jgi:hypothetical protein